MRTSIDRLKKDSKGFTLVEMAIAMVVLGLLVAPAASLYSLHIKNLKVEKTESAIDRASQALGGFRATYGRYPCPAAADAALGDPSYGYEDCTAAPPGIVLTGDGVLIGTLPFRELGVSEEALLDGHYNRLTYAVTESLTVSSTFSANGGRVSIEDIDGNSLISPAGTSHFAVVSHNRNDDGAWSRQGVQVGTCPVAPDPEGENCDADSTFVKASLRNGFDDRVLYAASVGRGQWQKQGSDERNIHLTSADNLAVGLASTAAPPVTAGSIEIASGTGNGTIFSSGGMFMAAQLCEHDGTGCFDPELVYGHHGAGTGLMCGNHEFLVGVENGLPVCESTISFSCPMGNFFAGIDNNGQIICDSTPPAGCADAIVTTTCGETFDHITATYSGGYSYAYSGKCYRAAVSEADVVADVTFIVEDTGTRLSALGTTITGGGTITDVENYIDDVNAAARTEEDCGDTAANAQVRDSFQCIAGSWGPHSPYRGYYASEMAHERLHSSSFPGDPESTGGSRPAETTVTATLATVNSIDHHNNNYNHDCWCREDYRVHLSSCDGGLTGDRLRIYVHRCPQTDHQWNTIYDNNAEYCGCVPDSGVNNNYQRCYYYFGNPSDGGSSSRWGRLSGYVDRNWDRICPTGPTGPASTTYTYDTMECTCHEVNDYDTVPCPFGTTSLPFTYDGINYPAGTNELWGRSWTCPTGDGGNISTPPEAALMHWTANTLLHTQTCDICAPQPDKDVLIAACPSHLTGTGTISHQEWDCGAGAYVEVSQTTDCHACAWTTHGSSYYSATAGSHQPGEICDCTADASASTICFVTSGSGYDRWNGCTCE